MKKIYAIALLGMLSASLLGCAPASPPAAFLTNTPVPTSTPENTATLASTSTPENTPTPAPTATLTPAPIPGIDEPIIVNGIKVQVLAAKWQEPQVVTGFQLKKGYRSLMLTFKLQSETTNSAADLLNGIEFRQLRVVDDQANENAVVVFNLPVSSLTGSDYARLDLFFVVLETTTLQMIRFVDGQIIELAPLFSE